METLSDDWFAFGAYRGWSDATLTARRALMAKLLWFLREKKYQRCGKREVMAFLTYVAEGHQEPGGRWGNPRMTTPVRPETPVTYYNILRAFFHYHAGEGNIPASPIENLPPPVSNADQVQPFTEEQLRALLDAAARGPHPARDRAVIKFLVDSGVRASELCGIRYRDLDLVARRCVVRGKGNKTRRVCFGRGTTQALWAYINPPKRKLEKGWENRVPRRVEHNPDDFVFIADRGTRAGEPLTRSGLGQLIRRHGRDAGLELVRSSPHTLRHTFAVNWLRGGGNVFTLKELLGHTTLTMVNRYVTLAEADIEAQHRIASPVDRMRL